MNDQKQESKLDYKPVSQLDVHSGTLFHTAIIRDVDELKALEDILHEDIDIHIIDCDPGGTSHFDVLNGEPYYRGFGPAMYPVLAIWVTSEKILDRINTQGSLS